MSLLVHCPHCQAQLRLQQAGDAGPVTVRCPRCEQNFLVGEEGITAAVRPRPAAPPPATDFEDAPPRSRRDEQRGPPHSANRGLVIGLSVGGGLLLLSLLVAVLILVLRPSGGAQAAALVGRWEKQGPAQMERLEFRADGGLAMDFAIVRLEKKYRLLDATTLEIEETMFKDFFKDFKVEGMPVQFNDNVGAALKHTVRFELRGDQLTFAPNTAGLTGTFRRAP